MARIPLITDRDELGPDGRAVFDRIVESRGTILRPFEALLHAPAMADRIAELGHVIRFESHLSDADRELVTLATGQAHGCAFVWDSHLEAARAAGLEPATIDGLKGEGTGLGTREAVLVSVVNELCNGGAVSDESFRAAHALIGTQGMIELVVTVGYYTMLGSTMSAFGIC